MNRDYDINAIIEEYADDDFGFSAVSDDEYKSELNQKDLAVQDYKDRLSELEKIILPFLTKLLKTSDQPIIKWPNRKEVLEQQIQKILSLTRG